MVISMSGLQETEKEALLALERQNQEDMLVMVPEYAFDGDEIIKLVLETAAAAIAFGQLLMEWQKQRTKQKEEQKDLTAVVAAKNLELEISKPDGEVLVLKAEQITQSALEVVAGLIGGNTATK